MTEILLYGEIGWEVNSGEFIKELSSIDSDEITLRISSPGGDVYDGLAIMNALRSHGAKITGVIEGLAASAASFIAVGGCDRIIMRPTADLMIHDAFSMAMGNAADFQKKIEDLERVSVRLSEIYAEKADGDPLSFREAMKAETWFTAEEALSAGLVDDIVDSRETLSRDPVEAFAGSKIMNTFQGRRGSPPATLMNHPEEGQEDNNMDIFKMLAQAMGVDEAKIKNAFETIVNQEQEVEIITKIDVEYPETVEVVPTGETKISPVETLPEGLTVAVGELPDGWETSVSEDTPGEISVKAPSGAEPDTTEEITITVTGDGSQEPDEFTVSVTVKESESVQDQNGDDQEQDHNDDDQNDDQSPDGDPVVADTVTIDAETYSELKAAAQLGWEAMKNKADEDLVSEVDAWVNEGRISAALRSKAVTAIRKDAESARATFGANPKGTIPRAEVGYASEKIGDEDSKSSPSPFSRAKF